MRCTDERPEILDRHRYVTRTSLGAIILRVGAEGASDRWKAGLHLEALQGLAFRRLLGAGRPGGMPWLFAFRIGSTGPASAWCCC